MMIENIGLIGMDVFQKKLQIVMLKEDILK
jgi:hypothetical protein